MNGKGVCDWFGGKGKVFTDEVKERKGRKEGKDEVKEGEVLTCCRLEGREEREVLTCCRLEGGKGSFNLLSSGGREGKF